MKILIWIVLSLAGIILIAYLSFWLYVRYGGEKVKIVNPTAWLQPNPGTDHRIEVDLQGPGNFRTFGGLQLDTLNLLKSGAIFRSDSPSKYTTEDWNKLEEMGVGLIIDLRSDKETEDDAYRTNEHMKYIRNPIYREDPMRAAFKTLMFERHRLPDMMQEGYVSMVLERAVHFGDAINLIAENLDKGIIFHCTAGKDRTGILSALILGYLGVDRETIVYDYALSNHGFESNYDAFLESGTSTIKWYGIPPDEMKVFFAVDPDWLISALDVIEDKYGSIESYLINEGGVSSENLVRLQEALIVSVN